MALCVLLFSTGLRDVRLVAKLRHSVASPEVARVSGKGNLDRGCPINQLVRCNLVAQPGDRDLRPVSSRLPDYPGINRRAPRLFRGRRGLENAGQEQSCSGWVDVHPPGQCLVAQLHLVGAEAWYWAIAIWLCGRAVLHVVMYEQCQSLSSLV